MTIHQRVGLVLMLFGVHAFIAVDHTEGQTFFWLSGLLMTSGAILLVAK
jgi:hypothetical protein